MLALVVALSNKGSKYRSKTQHNVNNLRFVMRIKCLQIQHYYLSEKVKSVLGPKRNDKIKF